MSSLRRDLHEENRLSWNAATAAHNSHKGDQAAYLRSGGSTLFSEERALLGDVSGQRLLHLLCNSGQDSLSLAALGADVTGVDISDEAIRVATDLSQRSGVHANFERSDVYDWLERAGAADPRWDIAYLSYGVIGWLSDVAAFTRGVAGVLAPGGRLVIMEFHPIAFSFDESWQPRWPYFASAGPDADEGIGDYVARSGEGLVPSGYEEGVRDFVNPHRSHYFPCGLGELVQSCLDAGLELRELREYPYSNGCKLELPGLELDAERRWRWKPGLPELPLMFSLVARKSR